MPFVVLGTGRATEPVVCGRLARVERRAVEPAVGSKGFASPRPWADAERMLEEALRALASAGGAPSLELHHVAFSPLGGDVGGPAVRDLSWEVDCSGLEVHVNAEHPASALEEAVVDLTAGRVQVVPPWAAPAWRWRGTGWPATLRGLAARCSHLRPSSEAGVDVVVERDEVSGRWTWLVRVPVTGDEGWPPSEWRGDDLASAVRAVMAEEHRWGRGLPAGHLLQEALAEERGPW